MNLEVIFKEGSSNDRPQLNTPKAVIIDFQIQSVKQDTAPRALCYALSILNQPCKQTFNTQTEVRLIFPFKK